MVNSHLLPRFGQFENKQITDVLKTKLCLCWGCQHRLMGIIDKYLFGASMEVLDWKWLEVIDDC